MELIKQSWAAHVVPAWVAPYSQVWKRARQYPILPTTTETINGPGPQTEMPKFSFLQMLIPLASLALMGGLYAIFFKGRTSYLLLMIPSTILSLGGTVAKYFANKKAYWQRMESRKQDYKNYLTWQCNHFGNLLEKQRQTLMQINPCASEWIQRVSQVSAQVWERSAADPDFLCIRVGIASIPASFKIVPPPNSGPMDVLIDTAMAISRDYMTVEAPLTVNLQNASLAVVGQALDRDNLLRSLVLQLTSAHSPEDVRLAILSDDEEQDWLWLRWLPHIWTHNRTRRMLANERTKAETLVERILSEMRGSLGHWFVLIPDARLLTEGFMNPLLSAAQAQESRLHVITCAATPQMVPGICRSMLVLGERAKASLRVIGPPSQETAFLADAVSLSEAQVFARAIASLRVAVTGNREIPDSLPLFAVLQNDFSSDRIIDSWLSASLKDLRIPLGVKAGGKPLLLDLHETGHGPHGLIAGTTGSGKSELIQTLIISLAAHFPPDLLAFMLIDYKGGGTGQAFAKLPHLVGVISNLDESLARRALVALRAEIEKRQQIFNEQQVTHIDEYLHLYRLGKAQEVLPRLVIIVDEFAELAQNMTDFLPELVSIARVGRSLGVHLILATQKPAGVVNDQIWSNARFKICLKVQDVGDSREMLRKPDAAYLTQPGRAYLMVGHDEQYELFQSGYGGAIVDNDSALHANQVYRVNPDGLRIAINTHKAIHQIPNHTQTQRIAAVDAIRTAFLESHYPAPPELWVAPLPKKLILEELPQSEPAKIVIGLMDNPVEVKQRPLIIDLDQGHLQIIGAPGTGKTTCLHTFVLSLARAMTPRQAAVYFLDLDKRQAKVLENLPNMGAVIVSYEDERMNRMFLNLLSILDERRELSPAELEEKPWIIVAIDNFPALIDLSEALHNTLIQLSRETGGLKILLILTATTMLSYRIAANFSQAIVLNMLDSSEYAMIAGPNPPKPAQLPGRGLIRAAHPLEIQIAQPARGENLSAVHAQVEKLVDLSWSNWKGKRVLPIPVKPEIVYWEELKTAPSRVSLGIHRVTLRNFQIPFGEGEYMAVTGTAGGGKTNLLLNIAVGLGQIYSPDQLALYIGAPESQELYLTSYLPQTAVYAVTLKDIKTMLEYIRAHLQNPDGRRVVLILDNFSLILRGTFPEVLQDVLGFGQQYKLTAICAGAAPVMASAERISRLLREKKSIWLGEMDPLDAAAFGFHKQRNGGKGKGYINLAGHIASIQTAIIQKPENVIKNIQAKYTRESAVLKGETHDFGANQF